MAVTRTTAAERRHAARNRRPIDRPRRHAARGREAVLLGGARWSPCCSACGLRLPGAVAPDLDGRPRQRLARGEVVNLRRPASARSHLLPLLGFLEPIRPSGASSPERIWQRAPRTARSPTSASWRAIRVPAAEIESERRRTWRNAWSATRRR